jgi:hypothetical protein
MFVLHGSTGLLGHSTLTVMATLRSFVCACPVFVAGLWRPVLVLGVTHDMVCGTPERTPMTTLIRDLYMHAVYLLTIEALKMCSLPRYLCRKSRIGIAERCVQVAASTIAPADVMLGMKLRIFNQYVMSSYDPNLPDPSISLTVWCLSLQARIYVSLVSARALNVTKPTSPCKRVHRSGMESFSE